ncbi:DNA cytosine methyltransferase [Hoeflea sp.]|uniref:DNA cytosine methyltransferase n=1 Tax=Hoeflea sp. TaxID=1940281 RepID=UPI002AFE8680|nr:DNA cytosine methyltransferase [Hoeflea sp.]
MSAPIIIDCFAGGGGASTGIEMALGRSPDFAINHDPVAVAMHAVNHPDTVHLCQNVYRVDPLDHLARAHIGFAWFSPDCKHFSKAKGGAPVQRNIRDLAWIIPGWIERIQKSGGRVDVVAIENVEEFQTWGPLLTTDKGLVPDPERKGETFKAWCTKLRRLGGKIEIKELRACDYGAPTIRKRVLILIRFDGQKIVWPEPTHGDPKSEVVKAGKLLPWRTAAEIIDWALPCPSIFDSKAEIWGRYGLRSVRPLAANTSARVARGIDRYVLQAARPFLVNLTHGARLEDADQPMRTVTCANRGEKVVVAPVLAGCGGRAAQSRPRGGAEPMATVTAKADTCLIAPSLTAYYGHGNGGLDRSADPAAPLQTVVTENRHAMVAPVMTYSQQGGSVRDPADPLHTVTASAKDVNAVIAAHMMTMRNSGKPFQGMDQPSHTVTAGGAGLACVAASLVQTGYGERAGQQPRALDPGAPLGTVVAGGVKHAPVAAYLAQHNGNGVIGRAAHEPLSTVTQAGSQQQVVAAHMLSMKGSARGGSEVDAPARTVCAGGGHATLVTGALTKYYGTGDGQETGDPLHTVTTKDRFCFSRAALAAPPFGPEHHERARQVADFMRAHGLWDEREFVSIEIDGATLVMVDIGMRMLTPRELFNAQGFPPDYRIDTDGEGNRFSKSDQVGRAGNSVCPPLAEAIARANAGHLAEFREAAE